jgi:sulfatase maturation enzyme AslB (radical SAM superfamily)
MSTNKILDNTAMYRLPYSKNDNPNGWIEVTTHCNMKCKGCYKGIDRLDSIAEHEPLEKIKSDILELKRIRNCGIITISGGEALLHPQIEEIVAFVKSKAMHSFIHTNGILINDELIRKLKMSGLTGLIVRVDILNRPDAENEAQLNQLREDIALRLKKIGGLKLGFTCVVNRQNIRQVHSVVKWVQENNYLTDYLVLILRREFQFSAGEQVNTSQDVELEELAAELKTKFPQMIFASWLGDQNNNVGYKWVNSAWIGSRGKVLGYADSQMVELSTMISHFKNKNYSYVAGKERNIISFGQMLLGSLLVAGMRPILGRYLKTLIKHPLSRANQQVINIVNPPGEKPESGGFCDACPDAILHNGILQPSCVLQSLVNLKKEEQNVN